MSALGQKQPCAAQKVMSALPPKADMYAALADVCFVPIADISIASRTNAASIQTRSRICGQFHSTLPSFAVRLVRRVG